jgi:hypothetical protein
MDWNCELLNHRSLLIMRGKRMRERWDIIVVLAVYTIADISIRSLPRNLSYRDPHTKPGES